MLLLLLTIRPLRMLLPQPVKLASFMCHQIFPLEQRELLILMEFISLAPANSNGRVTLPEEREYKTPLAGTGFSHGGRNTAIS